MRALLRQEGWLAPDVTAGLISLPAVGSDPRITAAARTAILRHELSHGEFFSNPEYAAYVRNFWLKELTGEERGSVRGFLAREDYDAREEELMFNEMQAYLMFTRDPVFFTPDMVGMSRGAAGRTAGPVPRRHAGRLAARRAGEISERRRRHADGRGPLRQRLQGHRGSRQARAALTQRCRSPPADRADRHRPAPALLGRGRSNSGSDDATAMIMSVPYGSPISPRRIAQVDRLAGDRRSAADRRRWRSSGSASCG